MTRQRLDQALVARGLVGSRSRAADLIGRGEVRVAGIAITKPGALVAADEPLEVVGEGAGYASRGALKLISALDHFGFEPAGLCVIDVGASTGGFTDVLLQRGARRVYAVDVGHGQLDPRLRADPRVAVLEGTDARSMDTSLIDEAPEAIVADVSFISLTKALPAVLRLAVPGAWLVALVKPQFEAGRDAVGKGGIVRDEAVRLASVELVRSWLASAPGWRVTGVIPSPISGGSGNIEYLLGARFDG